MRRFTKSQRCCLCLLFSQLTALGVIALSNSACAEGWRRHVIDSTSRGADGVRVDDFNHDGLPDIVTGWEEGGVVRMYLNPGPSAVVDPWPRVSVGKAKSPEDAFPVDLDQDGALDVVSCHEGNEQSIWFHWGPNGGSESAGHGLLDANRWKSQVLPATKGASRWMYGVPMQVDGKRGVDLIVGSKSPNGMVAWLESPENPRDVKQWKLHSIEAAGWIMSLEVVDMNNDGQEDIFVTDRKGNRRGAYWLEQSVGTSGRKWQRHNIGLADSEVMFAQTVSQGDGVPSVWVSTRNDGISRFSWSGDTKAWNRNSFANPFGVSAGKAIGVAGLGQGNYLLTHTTNTSAAKLAHKAPGVAATIARKSKQKGWQLDTWTDVSGLEGVKFDRIELLDLDADGDLDLVTCEERDNLGVIWYEQP